MPNATTISTARYRVQLKPHLGWWMQGDRYGMVQREYWARNSTKTRMVLVLLDKSNRLARIRAEDVEPIN